MRNSLLLPRVVSEDNWFLGKDNIFSHGLFQIFNWLMYLIVKSKSRKGEEWGLCLGTYQYDT